MIEDWKQAWKYLSMQVAAFAVMFGALPGETQAQILGLVNIPPERLPSILGLLMIVARMIRQPLRESNP